MLPFCVGMLITYYMTAIISHDVYGESYRIGWTAFTLVSPFLHILPGWQKKKTRFRSASALGIAAVSVLSSVVLFDRLRLR